MNLDLGQISALVSVLSAVVAWAIIPWRVTNLETRLSRLEESERDTSMRMVAIETELKLTRQTVEAIARKLDVT